MNLLSIIETIGNSYASCKEIYNIIGIVLGILTIYKAVYYAIGFLTC